MKHRTKVIQQNFKYWPFKCTTHPSHFLYSRIKFFKCARQVFCCWTEWSENINDHWKLKQESCAMTRLSLHKSTMVSTEQQAFWNLCFFFRPSAKHLVHFSRSQRQETMISCKRIKFLIHVDLKWLNQIWRAIGYRYTWPSLENHRL